MFKHSAIAFALVAASGLVSWAHAAPIISPFAADLSAGSYAASRAVGGSAQSAFNGGYWNAGGHGTHWIQADMGTSQTLSQVQMAIDVSPHTNTEQWIYLSDESVFTPDADLHLVAHRAGYTTKYEQFTLDFAAASGRYLLVVSNGGASWTAIGDSAPRSDWVDPGAGTGGGGAVPEPASLALVLGALTLLSGAQTVKRRRQAAPA